tara:strand:+ start:8296 stop:9531 length:1236 start_codon:yes stop_codon:yes gene_type:complete
MIERIDRYVLKEKVGAGGQAIVYMAEDTRLDKIVALKLMHQPASTASAYTEAVMNEAKLAAGLSHPNIATVFDANVADEYAYIVMEYFPNSLDKLLTEQGPLNPTNAVNITKQICEGLSHAHSKGIVHRDIKPHNILLDPQGNPKITDFGIARAADLSVSSATSSGTAQYMSPEQFRGETKPDVRSDIYSLGIILYEILTGQPPHEGSIYQLAQMHLNESLPDISKDLKVPPNLEKIIRKCVEKDPGDRYQNAAQLVTALYNLSKPATAKAAAPVPGQQQPSPAPDEGIPTGRDWRRHGKYTVLGKTGPDDRSGFTHNVQAAADEVVIVRRNGEIQDFFTEERKPTRSFSESLRSLFGLGPNIEVFKANLTRFNIIFWMGDQDTLVTGNKSFTFGLPVMTKDNQIISARTG